jgi:hypothetical protein
LQPPAYRELHVVKPRRGRADAEAVLTSAPTAVRGAARDLQRAVDRVGWRSRASEGSFSF